MSKLNKKIKEVAGNKVKSARSKLDSARNALDKMKKEITRLNVEIASSERDLQKARDKAANFEAEVKEAEEKMMEMKTEREQLEARGNEVIEKRKDLLEEEEKGKEALQHYRDSLAKLEKEENKFKSDRIEIEQTKEKFASAMKEQSKSIHHWKREIAKLELRDIPGEDKGELRVFQASTLYTSCKHPSAKYLSKRSGSYEFMFIVQSEEDLGELASINIEKMDQELNVLLENLDRQQPDLKAIDDYNRKENVYLERVAELEEVTAKKEAQRLEKPFI